MTSSHLRIAKVISFSAIYLLLGAFILIPPSSANADEHTELYASFAGHTFQMSEAGCNAFLNAVGGLGPYRGITAWTPPPYGGPFSSSSWPTPANNYANWEINESAGGPPNPACDGSYTFSSLDTDDIWINPESGTSTWFFWAMTSDDDGGIWNWTPIGYTPFTYDSSGSGTFTTPIDAFYYARIENVATTSALYSGPSTSSSTMEKLPNDWIVYVSTTTDTSGNPIVADGYDWYEVTVPNAQATSTGINPTDGVTGWMEGMNASSSAETLIDDYGNQAGLEASSSDYVATTTRPNMILGAIDYYYNNTSTSSSLYSSDDESDSTYHISLLNGPTYQYPEEAIAGIAAQEDGDPMFDNEYVTKDFGHGIMQLTFYPASGGWDNRGVSSLVTIPPCTTQGSLYENCYTDAANLGVRHYYQPYGGTSGNPTYKYYTNTAQSIYANIKDGMSYLAHSYNEFNYITTSTTTGGVTYSASDRRAILATGTYNGLIPDSPTECDYIGDVANRLNSIQTYFPDATTSAITELIGKMETAGTSTVCAQLESPGDISITSPQGQIAGVVNGSVVNSFPLAIVSRDQKYVEILAAQNGTYQFKVQGTKEGTYGLDITFNHGGEFTAFHASSIPILPGEIHTYTIDQDALATGGNGVMLQVDRTGTGAVDRTLTTGALLTGATYDIGATPDELKAVAFGDPPDQASIASQTSTNVAPAPSHESLSTTESGTANSVISEPNEYVYIPASETPNGVAILRAKDLMSTSTQQ